MSAQLSVFPRSLHRISPPTAIRSILGANVLLLLIQLSQLQPDWLATPMHRRGLAALIILLLAISALFLTSLFAYPTLTRLYAPFTRWLLARRIRAWTAAFLVFQFFVLTGLGIDRRPLFPHGSELLGVIACLDAVAILLTRRLSNEAPPRDASDSFANRQPLSANRIPDLALLAALLAVGLLSSAIFWLYAPPLAYGNFDSYRYFYASEGLLGRQPLDFAWYTYPYPLVIAATRLLADSVLTIVILQHALRIAFAALIFWSLRAEHRGVAAAAGLLIALSPIGAYQAHQLLDASLYSTLIGLVALLSYLAAHKDRPVKPFTLIAIGLLCAWIAVQRPLGQLLIVPAAVIVGLFAASWQRPAWMLGGFAAGVLLMMAGQYSLGGRFALGVQDEAFYAFPTIYLGLYDPANGPVAASYQAMLDSGECNYILPAHRWEIAKLYRWPHDLHNCAVAYNAAHGTALSTRALYLEAIRAQPLTFLANFYQELRLFLTHGDTGALEIEIGRLERLPFFTQTFSPVDGCKREVPEWTDIQPIESWFGYTCTYGVDPSTPLRRLIPDLYDAMLLTIQPYRLEGAQVWSRFWAALALVAFALLEGPRRLRPLVLLSALFVVYHAAVSVAAMFPQPRYVYFNVPFFLILVAVIAVTVWQGLRELQSRLAQTAALGAVALLPLIPGLLDGLWTDRDWSARYWQNPTFDGRPALTQREAVITHDWGDGVPFADWQPDYFSARYERTEYFPSSGLWTFAIKHDDGARIYLDGDLIYENWVPGFHDWAAVPREVSAGRHRLVVEYFEDTQTAVLQFGYYPAEP